MYKFIKRMIKEKCKKMQSQKQASPAGLDFDQPYIHLPKTYDFPDDFFANKNGIGTEYHD